MQILTILLHNIQHLPLMIDILSVELIDVNPDVLVLTDHKVSKIEIERFSFGTF